MKKRFLSVILTLSIICALFPTVTFAATYGSLTYEVNDDNTVTITDYNGYNKPVRDFVIPAEIDGLPVTSIGDDAFEFGSNLTSVTIPDSITYIGAGAFYHCSILNSVTIPDSVTSIGAGAFSMCDNLDSVYISDLAAYLNIDFGGSTSNPMYYADKLYINNQLATNIEIPYGVTQIPVYAFDGCDTLKSITIPESVAVIDSSAFGDCSSLININIPESVTYIGSSAFFGCDSLTNINIPESVNSISSSTFFGCDSLTNITIPESVTYIGDGAFQGCIGLTNITIPDNVTSIGESAFESCDNLINVSLGNGISNISENMFYNCKNLMSITIPDSVTSIGKDAFWGCDSLDRVYISDLASYLNIDFYGDTSTPMYYANKLYINNQRATKIEIPYGVTKIPSYAFFGCDSLTSVTVSGSVISIDAHAFDNCKGLTSVVLESGITTINNSAFYSCSNLKNITIPDSVTSISSSAFEGCISLTNLNYNAWRVFSDPFNNSTVSSVVLGDNVTSIDVSAFENCRNLEKIFIPKSVTEIEMAAFSGCDNLTEIEYGGSQADWDEIYIGIENECLTNANISFGKTSPTPEPDKNYPYTINDLSLKNTSGETITEAPVNKGFMVNVSFTKLMMRNVPDYIFVAVYDTDGAFLSLDYVQSNFAENYTYNVGFYIQPQKKEIGKIKAFVWNSFNDTTPLAEVKEL